jgi:hypothetical protein
MPNATFKFSEADAALLERLADELRCSKTETLRRALTFLDVDVRRQHEVVGEHKARLLARVPEGKTLYVGLDHDGEPFAAINGLERLDDVLLRGRGFSARDAEVVVIDLRLMDGERELFWPIAAVPVSGGWGVVDQRTPIRLVR